MRVTLVVPWQQRVNEGTTSGSILKQS